jgi:hypothetical protein
VEKIRGATNGDIATDSAHADHAADHGGDQVDHGGQGNDDDQGNRGDDELTQSQLQSCDLWNSQVDGDEDLDVEDEPLNLNAAIDLTELQHRRPPLSLASHPTRTQHVENARTGAQRGFAPLPDVDIGRGPMTVGGTPH